MTTTANSPARTDLEFKRIDASKPAGDQIFGSIKHAILNMDLQPGCIVSEAEIAAKFGASRTPVREAFMRLREAGLVVTYPSRGNFVSRLNKEKILEARYLREALEMANIRRLASGGLPSASHDRLLENLQAQEDAAAIGDAVVFGNLDDVFHLELAEATGFPRAAQVLEKEKMVLDRLRVLSLRDKNHLGFLKDEHARIFEAICAQDLSEAVRFGELHFSSILKVLSDLEIRHSDYFDD
ncbi:GntR family transcriptional regulator [Roseibium porphyridii]|uniref:GntR family transcriptional regulator n=1 Tax=Roseibium porphyridii TaxID=2866279 RepID=A0ABY8F6T6_9HYPH|nr:GntR family transcriptional regulator [Roseibium sp. KMA01]WFE91208.1 GntR family transcriptional regulator [Roseibium sp. KMA01]